MSSALFVVISMALMVTSIVEMTSSSAVSTDIAAAVVDDDQETVRAMIAELNKIRDHLVCK